MPLTSPPETIAAQKMRLQSGKTTSRALIETALTRISDEGSEGKRVFTAVYAERARAEADAADKLRPFLADPPPLFGLPISIKDLFDVAGDVTRAGSTFLNENNPAIQDAPIIARLRAAGAILIGRTNMTEFAFSGLGINPHYGTPGNPANRNRIPGGSSSGAAVSVCDGMAVAAIGTDTGGSVRIPAAFTGLAGFKPTQSRIPLEGTVPLAFSLDSIGPLAPSVACCAQLDAVMAGETPFLPKAEPLSSRRYAVPENVVFEGADDTVTAAFTSTMDALRTAGAEISTIHVPEFDAIMDLGSRYGGMATMEAWWWHQDLVAAHHDAYDPQVVSRILMGKELPAASYIAWLQARHKLIATWHARIQPFDAVLMPTVAVTAPKFEDLAEPAQYHAWNQLILRNTLMINCLDGAAASIPITQPGQLPVGLMVVNANLADRQCLQMAASIEAEIHIDRN